MTTAFTHVRQPNNHTCAPACVAIVTGADLDELIAEMRPTPKAGAANRLIVRALRDRGFRCDDRFRSLRGRPFPHTAIIRISYPGRRCGHVVVKQGRTWFDPLLESSFEGDPPRAAVTPWVGGSRITSALWVGAP